MVAEPYDGQTYDSYVSFEAVVMLVMITDRPPVLQLCSINSNGNLYNSDEHAAE